MHTKTTASGRTASPDDTQVAMDSLRRIVRSLRIFSHRTESSLAVSGAQLFVLQSLEEEPGMSLVALARRTLTDPSSVSVVVRRLVEAGMIKRRTAGDDARRSHLELTTRGRALLRKSPQAVQARLVEGLRSLPPRELRNVARVLRKLVDHMGAGGDVPTMFFETDARRAAGRGKATRFRT
jgi:DNA-binding MarR family transcriptional regulator